jgi:hypothetical protein
VILSISPLNNVGISLLHLVDQYLYGIGGKYIIAIGHKEIIAMHLREQVSTSLSHTLVLCIADNLYVSLTMGIALHDLMQHLDAAVRSAVVAEDILKVCVCLLKERLSTLGYVLLHTIYGNKDGNCHVV